jgi:hypothetical protein
MRFTNLRNRKFLFLATASLAGLAAASFAFSTGAQSQDRGVQIRTLSSMPNRISGGDTLVEITAPAGAKVSLNGGDISSSFHPGTKPGTLMGLVEGLKIGKNELKVTGAGTGALELTDYSIKGPIVSGPQVKPFYCETQSFTLPGYPPAKGTRGNDATLVVAPGSSLGQPIDADCSIKTRVDYVYMPKGGTAFVPLANPKVAPADMSMTTTSAGASVPFIVRVETGTMNRGIYQNAILFNPAKDAAPSPFAPPKGWNHRLISIHGAGCPGGWYTQGTREGVDVLQPQYLAQGYALFINTLDNPSNSCNTFAAGESAMMGKEHFIKTFGVPDFTMSTGGSGGAYTSLGVADAFPGLIDGVFINLVFPDAQIIGLSGLDGHLLTHYFAVTNPKGFTMDQQVAVSGYKGQQAWIDASNQAQRTDAVPGRADIKGYNSAVWNDIVPQDVRYDPVKNPKGARPTIWDVSKATYGVDPATGFALRTYDNTGVQYGLAALNAGTITKAQFIDLNNKIGGYDRDDNYVATRTVADVSALKSSYEVGATLGGNGGLSSIPIIDFGSYNDTSGYHYQWFHFAARERLAKANGNANNYVMWRGDNKTNIPVTKAADVMAKWVSAIKADNRPGTAQEKMARNRPAAATDGCFDTSATPKFLAEKQTFSHAPDSKCNTLFPSYGFARLVAGGPLSFNNLKCQTRPIDAADYKVAFTADETAQLKHVFPQGVCDWSKNGVAFHGVMPGKSLGPAPSREGMDNAKNDGMTKSSKG